MLVVFLFAGLYGDGGREWEKKTGNWLDPPDTQRWKPANELEPKIFGVLCLRWQLIWKLEAIYQIQTEEFQGQIPPATHPTDRSHSKQIFRILPSSCSLLLPPYNRKWRSLSIHSRCPQPPSEQHQNISRLHEMITKKISEGAETVAYFKLHFHISALNLLCKLNIMNNDLCCH